MKRFVTYLYLYDGRIKGNNAGFIKVEINGEKSAFLVQIKNLGKYSGKGRVYPRFDDVARLQLRGRTDALAIFQRNAVATFQQ